MGIPKRAAAMISCPCPTCTADRLLLGFLVLLAAFVIAAVAAA
jgi:hypothetical protein